DSGALDPDEAVRWFFDSVTLMTGDASGMIGLVEELLLRTRLVQVRLPNVALPADLVEMRDDIGSRTVTAMTRAAGRRRQVSTFECLRVHAVSPVFWRVGEAERLHAVVVCAR